MEVPVSQTRADPAPAREIATTSDSWIVSPSVFDCHASRFAAFRATRRTGGNIPGAKRKKGISRKKPKVSFS